MEAMQAAIVASMTETEHVNLEEQKQEAPGVFQQLGNFLGMNRQEQEEDKKE